MKSFLAMGLALALALTLTACAASAGSVSPPGSVPEEPGQTDVSQPEEPDHSHQRAQADNILPHEEVGYCGNTITKVRQNERLEEDPWEVSFWGSDSVALTDLLIHLDYSGEICRCLPEYYVDTEFSQEAYGLNLTSGYVRYGEGQVELTQEQVELIQGILERNPPD